MKTVGKTLLVMLVPIATLGLACSDQSPRGKEEAKKAEAKKVPLDSIYSTNGQQGVKAVDREELGELYDLARRIGASNVFMARGDDIAAALGATWRVFRAPWHPVDEPVTSDQRVESGNFWLVAYLGVGGKGGGWLAKSTAVKGTEVRLSYVKGTADKRDRHPYFAWIPLGKLKPGAYSVELFDEDAQEVTLRRRLTIANE